MSKFLYAEKVAKDKEPMKQRTLQLIKHINKAYGLAQQLIRINDARLNPQVLLKKILLIIVFSIVTGLHNFNM